MATHSQSCYFNLALSLHFETAVVNINPLCCYRCYNFHTRIRSYLIRFCGFISTSVWLILRIRKQPFYIPLPTELWKLGHL